MCKPLLRPTSDAAGQSFRAGRARRSREASSLLRWRQQTLSDLDGFEYSQMLLTAPVPPSAQQYVDITSFILEKNGFSAASQQTRPRRAR